jgi:hypothetical protein
MIIDAFLCRYPTFHRRPGMRVRSFRFQGHASSSHQSRWKLRPPLCHPACPARPACPGLPWGLPWGVPWDRSVPRNSYCAAVDSTACAAFSKESRMKFPSANGSDRKSVGAKWRDLQFTELTSDLDGSSALTFVIPPVPPVPPAPPAPACRGACRGTEAYPGFPTARHYPSPRVRLSVKKAA